MSFDLLAPHYRWMEKVLAGEKLQRVRTAFLDDIAHSKNALICGEGSGRFLNAFLTVNPTAQIVCLDASKGMLEVMAKNLRESDRKRVEFVHTDILQWPAPREQFDLIVTNFFLDCFTSEQLTCIAQNLSKSARADARWLLSDFHEPDHGLARTRARIILWSMYRFFRIATKLPAKRLSTPDSFLQQNGFRLVKQQLSEWGLLRADLWQRNHGKE